MIFLRSTVLAIAACTILGSMAAAQASVGAAGGALARVDSARVLRSARAAQAAFERVRYRNFPWTESYRGGSGACDEQVGRFCIWHDDTERDWEPPPERDAVKRERAGLIAALDSAAAASPGDAWIAGQRVRYLVEAGRQAEAARATDACRAERWWCLALRGYAQHFAGDYVTAAGTFAAAVEAMPPAERRAWEDLAPAVTDEDARALRRMDPASRAAAIRRLWWLADPFWMQPGNDRLTEHYARLVADRFQDRARTSEGLAWADDLREILVRWGQPSGWERIRPRTGQTMDGGMVTHYAPSFEFIPTLAMARDPFAIRAPEWKTEEKGAHSAYAPPGVRRLAPLPHQLAAFRRDGRAEVVAAFAMQPDSLPAHPALDAGVVLMGDVDAPPVAQTARVSGTRGVLRLRAEPTQAVVSIEAREPISRRAARGRFGVDLRRLGEAGLSISDVLLLDRADARPASLDEAAPLARGATDFVPGDRIALYWEVYGVRGGADSVTFSVALARRPPGAARRAAESLGLARAATPVRMRWVEEPPATEVLARSLAIALPRVSPGDYVLEVAVRTRSGATAFTRRELTVRRANQAP